MSESSSNGLPGYAPLLTAYHQAFRAELEAMLEVIPLGRVARVLDVATGDGFYAPLLVKRCPDAEIVAIDLERAWLDEAERTNSSRAGDVQLAEADIDSLPFADDSFDFVWCAQSFFSLPSAVKALREMRRVTRAGGCVAVLEDDKLHHVMAPWPIELELAVRRAEYEALSDEKRSPRKYYIGRRLGEIFCDAGFSHFEKRSWASTRQHPLPKAEREFLKYYLEALSDRVRERLPGNMREEFDGWVNVEAENSPVSSRGFTLTVIDHVVWGRKSKDEGGRMKDE